ncbi:hypothetical protein DPMN_042944 [Dreissena polymorpha]|nr:hypothetical protein DPMN_042944 [Dreissena polymorpha]
MGLGGWLSLVRHAFRSFSQDQRGHPKLLFSRSYLRTTLQLWVLWFGTALTYYGMVLASAEILQLHNAKTAGKNVHRVLLHI